MHSTLHRSEVTNALHLLADVFANREASIREHQPTDTQIADNDNVHD